MSDDRILLVDDEDEFARILSERLEARGLKVEVADSGLAAIEKVRQKTFDVVVLDMVMPMMDGMETLKRLKAENPELQVILLTGYATVEKGVAAIQMGAADFLEKPADIDRLMEKIKNAAVKKTLLVEKKYRDRIEGILKEKGW